MLNVSKVKAAIDSAKSEISVLYKQSVAAGEKDPNALNGLKSLGKANLALDKVVERLDAAVEATTPKVKEKKADSKEKKADKK